MVNLGVTLLLRRNSQFKKKKKNGAPKYCGVFRLPVDKSCAKWYNTRDTHKHRGTHIQWAQFTKNSAAAQLAQVKAKCGKPV